jgi:hypothetical protein
MDRGGPTSTRPPKENNKQKTSFVGFNEEAEKKLDAPPTGRAVYWAGKAALVNRL